MQVRTRRVSKLANTLLKIKMKTETSIKKKWLYASVVILIGVAIVIYQGWLRSLPHGYTVGEITEIYHPGKGNKQAIFTYMLKGHFFENKVSILEGQKPEVGDKYIVEFPLRFNGKHGLMRLGLPVGDDLVPPENGWTQLPPSAFLQ